MKQGKRGLKTYSKVKELYNKGYSIPEIADKLDLWKQTVRRYIRGSKKARNIGSIPVGTIIHLPKSFSFDCQKTNLKKEKKS